jgi:hypothetical protein
LEVPIRAVVTEVKAGRTLSAKNETKIRDAMSTIAGGLAALQEVLDAAMPEEPSAPKTFPHLESVKALTEGIL